MVPVGVFCDNYFLIDEIKVIKIVVLSWIHLVTLVLNHEFSIKITVNEEA